MGVANRIIVAPGGTITAAGDSGPIRATSDVDPSGMDFVINLAGFTGGTTPSITFTASWDNDAVGDTYPPASWTAGTSTAALTAAGTTTLTLPATFATTGTTPRYARLSWTLVGAPTSVNFTNGIFCE